jgi:hypothetical protein
MRSYCDGEDIKSGDIDGCTGFQPPPPALNRNNFLFCFNAVSTYVPGICESPPRLCLKRLILSMFGPEESTILGRCPVNLNIPAPKLKGGGGALNGPQKKRRQFSRKRLSTIFITFQ